MPQSSCYTNLFVQGNSFTTGTNILAITVGHLGKRYIPQKPFIPYVGMVLDASGVYIPDTIANNKLFQLTFVNALKEFRTASINMATNVIGGSEYISDLYLQYLYKTTFANSQNLLRYMQNAGIVFNFWNTANAAWTAEQYNAALNNLFTTLNDQAAKEFYVPPGQYDILAASAFGLNVTAWQAANPNMTAFKVIEFYQ